ncbi:MAG: hypothetical protein V1672_04350 [Candidatus Diapherotrites archaeon]
MPKKKKDVHFGFKAHTGGETFGFSDRPSKKTKTVIFEESKGWKGSEGPYAIEDLPSSDEGLSEFQRTQKQYMLNALEDGKKIMAAETIFDKKRMKQYVQVSKKLELAQQKFHSTPNLQNAKEFFRATAEYHKLRHKVIRETVHREEKPLEAPHFGSMHSLLLKELRKEEIDTSYEGEPMLCNWQDFIVRKMLIGEKSAKVTETEYKRAYVSYCMLYDSAVFSALVGQKGKPVNNKQLTFKSLADRVLIGNLSEIQLDKIINSGNFRLVFEYNGLSGTPTRKDIEKFLDKHSTFWKRQKIITGKENPF